MCHIIKNLPPVRCLMKKIDNRDENTSGTEKMEIEAFVMNKAEKELPCKLQFISEAGMSKIRLIYRNHKFVTDKHLRMIDALQELRRKLNEYGLVLKLCSCCKYYTSNLDGSTNVLKGFCNNDYPSPSLNGQKSTLIWNSCTDFVPAEVCELLEDMVTE